ncbi:UDP-3-O-(3-hydroxymyristoyl)glucosamine N-acyltransferase [uncultured Draconibacterium sp.]|uniref:UDP-3-O-(3-hydroxymyristoyl)glucosamine N-acyltransferase n=1 Tax=uncultured Draconibacterium sp. TaxID=1573823 RepID=UPI0025E0CBBF|nr:UDP-3-O-(3-hydroxymyristoyl)glucosamine N-acyltransferase [uncultured Draconibacterium sp.]
MDFKATDIASFLNGEIVGDGDAKVSNVSKIEDGKPGTLAFLANPKYEHYIYETKASVVLVNKSFSPKEDISATLIKVDDAYQAFASLLELYVQAKASMKQGIEQPCYIAESATRGEDGYVGAFAYIGNNAKIGNNVKIYPQVHVGDNVTIGDDCILYPGAKIYDDCVIGNRCIIHSGAVIGADGFGFAPQEDGTYKKIHQIGNAVLEDDVEIGANTTIDCGTMESTIIRKGVKLDNLIQIAHNVEVGDNTVMAAQTGVSGSAKVGKNCMFGGQVGLGGHITIGDNVTLGAQSGVVSNLKSNQTLLGSPAIEIKTAMRAYVLLKDLPEIRRDVLQLKKTINTDKKN